MKKYSIFSLVRNAVSYHERWSEAWRSPEPKGAYEVVIVGGNDRLTAARLALVQGAACVIASGLRIFGVEPVEELR